MKDQKNEMTVTLIDVEDFLKKYPRFSSLVNGAGMELFDVIVTTQVFVDASVLANYGYPSVLGVAKQCQKVINNSDELDTDSFTKQFIGSVICSLMEANGYQKTGIKKSVPHKLFSTGEFYEKKLNISRIDSVNSCGTDRLANLETVDTNVTI